MHEVKFELHISGIIDDKTDCQIVDTAVTQDILDMYPVNRYILKLQIQ